MINIQTTIILISLAAFVLNLPFGFMRRHTRRFSLGWFACIHIPIICVAIIRISTHTPWAFAPLFLAAGIFGQIAGYRIRIKSNTL